MSKIKCPYCEREKHHALCPKVVNPPGGYESARQPEASHQPWSCDDLPMEDKLTLKAELKGIKDSLSHQPDEAPVCSKIDGAHLVCIGIDNGIKAHQDIIATHSIMPREWHEGVIAGLHMAKGIIGSEIVTQRESSQPDERPAVDEAEILHLVMEMAAMVQDGRPYLGKMAAALRPYLTRPKREISPLSHDDYIAATDAMAKGLEGHQSIAYTEIELAEKALQGLVKSFDIRRRGSDV
jgi:hypothetical protein